MAETQKVNERLRLTETELRQSRENFDLNTKKVGFCSLNPSFSASTQQTTMSYLSVLVLTFFSSLLSDNLSLLYCIVSFLRLSRINQLMFYLVLVSFWPFTPLVLRIYLSYQFNTRLAIAESEKREKRALERKLSEMEEELKVGDLILHTYSSTHTHTHAHAPSRAHTIAHTYIFVSIVYHI